MSYHSKHAASLTPKVFQGAGFVNAAANAAANVADVVELSSGELITQGEVFWRSHGLTVGAYYFLSQTTPGGYTSVMPTTGLVQRLFFVRDANNIIVDVQPAEAATSTGANETLQFVALDTPISLDNIRVEARLTGGQGFRIGTVAGTITADLAAFSAYAVDGIWSSNRPGITLTTTMTHPFGWSGQTDGDLGEITLIDRTNVRVYEIKVLTRTAPVTSMIHIKRTFG